MNGYVQKEREPGDVALAMDALGAQLDRVSHQLEMLGQALAPVLRPEPAGPDSRAPQDVAVGGHSPLGTQLSVAVARCEALADLAARLWARVAL